MVCRVHVPLDTYGRLTVANTRNLPPPFHYTQVLQDVLLLGSHRPRGRRRALQARAPPACLLTARRPPGRRPTATAPSLLALLACATLLPSPPGPPRRRPSLFMRRFTQLMPTIGTPELVWKVLALLSLVWTAVFTLPYVLKCLKYPHKVGGLIEVWLWRCQVGLGLGCHA